MRITSITFGLLLAMNVISPLHAQISAFTYQGRLNLNGGFANGYYDFMFRLLNDPTNGVAAPVIPINLAVPVTNGLFTTGMDFGAENFNGANRWLEINVRTNSGGQFTTLSPRQLITSAPYAIRSANATSAVNVSGSVSAAQLTGTISPNNIGAGSISTAMLVAGAVGSNQLAAGAVTTGALAHGAVTAAKVATVSDWFALTIANPTPATGDGFGVSVAAMGTDRMLIGAPYDDAGATNSGTAYLFSSSGALLTVFTNPTPETSDLFGWAVAAVGADRALIGAPFNSTGAAYLFSTNGTLLTVFTKPTPGGNFGVSVAAVGTDRVLIGAPLDATGAVNAGVAYLFSTNGALLNTFTNPTPAESDYFGWFVAAVDTDRVLIGAYGDDTGAGDAGAAYLFSTSGLLITTFTNPTPAAIDWFGASVAAIGTDRVLIGSPHDNTGATDAGAAYLFGTNGSLLTTLTNPIPAHGGAFGISVAAVGNDRVLVGTGASDAGKAYLFDPDGTLLTTFTNPTPSASDNFGRTVAALGADRVLITAGSANTGAINTGAAYLFSLESFTPGLIADGVNARSITTASLEDGAVTALKIGGVLFADQIPNLDALKISSGVLDTNRIPGLDASKIATGVLNANRIPNLDASKIVVGTLADARLGANVALLNRTNVFIGTNRFAGVTLATNANNQFNGNFIGSGSGLTNLDAATLGGLNRSNYWQLGGNQVGAGQFLGSQNNQPVEIRVNGAKTMSWSYASNTTSGVSPNIIGGFAGNFVASDVVGATIVGGGIAGLSGTNSVLADFGTVVGGRANTASGLYATAMGVNTRASGRAATAVNEGAEASGISSFAGGYGTTASGISSTAMGVLSKASGSASTAFGDSSVAAGYASTAMGNTSTASGFISTAIGAYSTASGDYSTAIGFFAKATNSWGFAVGYRAVANHLGAFVWGDVSEGDITSTNDNSATMRASGGYRLFTDSTATAGAFLAAGSGSWTSMSDRNAKENFHATDTSEVLEKVVALQLQTWNYKSQDSGIRHIGPTAQDFKAAFDVGESDTGISTVDADGVALAAIQGLNQKLEEARTENAKLVQRLEKLEHLVNALSSVRR